MYVDPEEINSGYTVTLVNNLIYSNSNFAILFNTSQNRAGTSNFFNNTVYQSDGTPDIRITGGANTIVSVRNDILVTADSTPLISTDSMSLGAYQGDYNDFYNGGASTIFAAAGVTTFAELADWFAAT